MAGWHHWLDGHRFGWTLGVCDGQGGLACCSSCGRKESDMTEQLNWTEQNWDANSSLHSKTTHQPLALVSGMVDWPVALMACVHALQHLTLCDLLDCSPPGSFVHGIPQGRILYLLCRCITENQIELSLSDIIINSWFKKIHVSLLPIESRARASLRVTFFPCIECTGSEAGK